MTFKASYKDHYKLTKTVLWRITYTSTDFTFNIFNITISFTLIYSWSSLFKPIIMVKQILFPRLFFPCYIYWHNINCEGCEIKVPYKVCVHIHTLTVWKNSMPKLHEMIGETKTRYILSNNYMSDMHPCSAMDHQNGSMVGNEAKPLKYSEEM